jgi:rhodanese-related sulfurtransferase
LSLRLAEWGKDLTRFSVLAIAALCLGALTNQARQHPLPLIYVPATERVDVAGAIMPVTVGLPEFREFAQSGKGVIVDARPEAFFRLGHVPGAISLPRAQFERDYPTREELRHKERPIAVYCSAPDCEDSYRVAAALSNLGHRRVLVFKGGWEAWIGASLPTEPGP